MRDNVRGLTAQLYIHYFPPPPAGVAQHLRYLFIHKVPIRQHVRFLIELQSFEFFSREIHLETKFHESFLVTRVYLYVHTTKRRCISV